MFDEQADDFNVPVLARSIERRITFDSQHIRHVRHMLNEKFDDSDVP